MAVYSCRCLNVRIFAEKLEANPGILGTCPLGSSCESVQLVGQGFHFNHKCLVHRVRDKDWTVYICVPCHMRTHAVNLNARLVVVSSKMKKGEGAIQRIKNDADFSQVFNLLLRSSDGKQRNGGGVQPQNYDTLQKQLVDLQNVLSNYLKQEEEAMERRISDYEENERLIFAKLKEKAQQEKAKLISMLFHNCGSNSPNGSTDKSSLRKHALPRNANEYDGEERAQHRRGKQSRMMRDSSPDVFTMDGIDIDEMDEDYESREATKTSQKRRPAKLKESYVQQFGRLQAFALDTTDENENEHAAMSAMSTSMPISVPAHFRNLRNFSYLDEDFEKPSEFDDIPKNMQALSESIQERDRYIFGDRPRQRVHTGDFTQVNWH
ncbi:hypothetical protein BsWGS_18797 [Bradybaena similaris]